MAKRFDGPSSRPPGQEQGIMGWKDSAVQREHMNLIIRFWHKWVSVIDPEITPTIAAQVWRMFAENPKSQEPPVRVMKALTNRIFSDYVVLN